MKMLLVIFQIQLFEVKFLNSNLFIFIPCIHLKNEIDYNLSEVDDSWW